MVTKRTSPKKKTVSTRTNPARATQTRREPAPVSAAPVVRQHQTAHQPVSVVPRVQTTSPVQASTVHIQTLERPGLRSAVGEREHKALPPRPRSRHSLSMWRYVFFTILVSCCVGGAVWYFFTEHLTAEEKKQAYVQSITTKVSQLVLTPAGEIPTIGVIPDPNSITENKDFFKNASQGDYLLVYPHARLMIIYSPGKNIVVNMGYAEATPPASR